MSDTGANVTRLGLVNPETMGKWGLLIYSAPGKNLTLGQVFEAWLQGTYALKRHAKVIGKTLTKAEVYRACFKDFLLNNQDMAKAFALSKALTRQEFRYFKQAYKALPPCSFPSSSLNPSFWNYLEVVAAYDYTKT